MRPPARMARSPLPETRFALCVCVFVHRLSAFRRVVSLQLLSQAALPPCKQKTGLFSAFRFVLLLILLLAFLTAPVFDSIQIPYDLRLLAFRVHRFFAFLHFTLLSFR